MTQGGVTPLGPLVPDSLGMDTGAQGSGVPAELGPGSVIGGYRLNAILGRGGMGVVYRATQMALNRSVALKVMDPRFAEDPTFRERFRRESQQAAALDHPNVITIHEAGEEGGRLFVSMRLVEGVDLRQLLDTVGPLKPPRALSILAQVGAALDAAHAKGLVHRDVKPANILVEQRAGSEVAYLSDFGLVKRIGIDPALTGSAGWVGSVDYVAPEQVQGRLPDKRTDIYALGAVLYTSLTGQVPFPRPDMAAGLYASVNDPVPPLGTVRPGLPPQLDAVVARAMAKDPAARHSSSAELLRAASQAIGGGVDDGSPTATADLTTRKARPPIPEDTARRRRRRRWQAGAVAATLVVVALVAATLAGVWSSGSTNGPGGLAARHSTSTTPPTTANRATRTTQPSAGTGSPQSRGVITADDVTGGVGGDQPDHYRLTIYDLRRWGPYVTLDFGIACTKATSGSCDTESDFAVRPSSGLGTTSGLTLNDVGAIQLVDRVQKKEYGEVTDAKLDRYCSAIPPSLDVGQAVHLAWATFPAPSASSSTMDVIFPNGGPEIPDVPITTGRARVPAANRSVIPAHQAPFDRPPGSTETAGLTMPVYDLILTVGGPSGSDAEAAGRSTITLSTDVLFAFAKSDLTPTAQGVLSTVADRIKAGGHGTVSVTGYTDSIGPDSVNVPLSQARAQAVVSALTPLVAGAPVTLQAAGDGSADPVAPNTNSDGSDNPAGRALNRRVTVAYAVSNSPPPAAPAPAPSPSPTTLAPGPDRAVDYVSDVGGVTSHYHISATSLQRRGALMVLHLTATCTTATNDDDGSPNVSCDGEFDFAGTNTVPPELNGPYNTLGAIYLTNPSSNQVSIVVHDSQQNPLAAAANPQWPVGGTYPLWLYFPALPSSVRALTVEMPGAAAQITNLAITS